MTSTPELPSELFVIVTRDASPMARHNMRLGRIASAGAAYAEIDSETYLNERDQWLPWLPNPQYERCVSFRAARITNEMCESRR